MSTVATALMAAPDRLTAVRAELETFKTECIRRERFNSRMDNLLNALGILLSVAIIAAGTWEQSKIAAVLGGLVAAIVTTQRAFPFAQRMHFYRSLIGQTENLVTDSTAGLGTVEQIASTLKSLRLDFAQQLPRGAGFRGEEGGGKAT